MTEYKIGKAIVRMHGEPDRQKVEAATIKFLQRVELQKLLDAYKRKEGR